VLVSFLQEVNSKSSTAVVKIIFFINVILRYMK
jgi:hypothetical protein